MIRFYSTPEWHKLRAQTRARWKRAGLPCAYCGEPLTWERGQTVVDHIKNRKQYPNLAHEPSNLQVVHHGCNTRKAAHVENTNKVEIGADGFPVNSEWTA